MLSLTNRVIVVILVGAAAIGALDAVIGGTWDLVALFGVIAFGELALLSRAGWRRRDVTLRADLARWLEQTAAVGDERPEDVADRAITVYRDLLGGGSAAPR
jgi:hypothetical protein